MNYNRVKDCLVCWSFAHLHDRCTYTSIQFSCFSLVGVSIRVHVAVELGSSADVIWDGLNSIDEHGDTTGICFLLLFSVFGKVVIVTLLLHDKFCVLEGRSESNWHNVTTVRV